MTLVVGLCVLSVVVSEDKGEEDRFCHVEPTNSENLRSFQGLQQSRW